MFFRKRGYQVQGAVEFSDFCALKFGPIHLEVRAVQTFLPKPFKARALKSSPPPSFVLYVGALNTTFNSSFHYLFPAMKVVTPEISWHGRDPVYSVDFQFLDGDIRRLATCGTDRHVRVSVNPGVDPRGSGVVSVPRWGHPTFSHLWN